MKSDAETRKSGMRVKRSSGSLIWSAIAVVALGACMVGCTTKEGGVPTSTGSPSSIDRPGIPGGGGTSSARPDVSSKTPGANPISGIDACSLLTSAEQSTLSTGSGKPKADQTDLDKGCIWKSNDLGMYIVQVNVYGNLGQKDIVSPGGVKPISDIGKHKAVQFVLDPVCVISFALTDASRVDVGGSTGNDAEKGCQLAKQAAQMVESKLPGGS